MKRIVISALAAVALFSGLAVTAAGASVTTARPANVVGSVFTGPSNPGGVTPVSPQQPCNVPLSGVTCTLPMAGWYTNAFAQTFTQVDATFTLNPQSEGIGVTAFSAGPNPGPAGPVNGAIGAQLCSASSGQVAQIGVAYAGLVNGVPTFYAGYTTNTLHGLANDPCVGGGVVNPSIGQFNVLGAIPVNSTVQVEIRQVFEDGHPAGLLFTAADSATVNYTYFLPGWGYYPNQAGAGLQANTTGLAAPAVNDLTDFSGVTATSQGQTHGLAYWNAVQVESSQDGLAPALLAPSMITPSQSSCTWHPGHRYYYGSKGHRHYRWIRGYWTCQGGSASSFSVWAGTPVS